MIHNMRDFFLLALSWLWSFNPDPWIKLLAALASVATIISAYYTIKKNRQK